MHSQPGPPANNLTPPAASTPAPPSFPFAIVIFVWLLVVFVTILVTMILPESYSSTVRIQIERDRTDIPGLATPATASAYDPFFIQTEFEVMQSELVLRQVVEDIDLNSEWGKRYAGGDRLKTSETLSLLKNRLDLRPVRNTSIIEIRVFSEKPEEAAKIANRIAEAYKKHRQDQRTALSRGGITALEERFQAQEEKVRAAQTVVDRLRKDLEQEIGTAITNEIVMATHSRPYFDARRNLEQLQRFRDDLYSKIANEQIDAALPATRMVQIVDTAHPGLRPVRPNKPLNIMVGIVVGAVAGFVPGTVIYGLQRRAFRRASGLPRAQLPPGFRAVAHVIIALIVGLVVGYHCASPLDGSTFIVVPLALILGGFASAYLEICKPGDTSARGGQSRAYKSAW
jgi:uncharacterized protein involved in exopolysaccharide biosynthesis